MRISHWFLVVKPSSRSSSWMSSEKGNDWMLTQGWSRTQVVRQAVSILSFIGLRFTLHCETSTKSSLTLQGSSGLVGSKVLD